MFAADDPGPSLSDKPTSVQRSQDEMAQDCGPCSQDRAGDHRGPTTLTLRPFFAA
jgi:hypothetical protein